MEESISNPLPAIGKRLWYLTTNPFNSIYHLRDDTRIQKEGNLLNQLRKRHQFLMVRLPSKKISIPVKLNGIIQRQDDISNHLRRNYRGLSQDEYKSIFHAYNEWLELHDKVNVDASIQPVLTVAESPYILEETAPINNNHDNSHSSLPVANQIITDSSLPVADQIRRYQTGTGKKTKANRKKSNKITKKKTKKSRKTRK